LKEPGRDPSSNSYMWVRAREEKTGPPIILYDYFPSRGTKVINELLMDYCGILQTDGYKSYDSYTQNRDIIHAGCLAHCRRKFWEAFKASKKAKDSYAEQGLKWIKAIYKIEAETKQMTAEQRLAHREKFMAPIMSNFKEWLDDSINKVPSSLKTGEAM